MLDGSKKGDGQTRKTSQYLVDNGTNFVGAEKELREALKRLDSEWIGDQLSDEIVQWQFNPPSSPHFGGAWKRLVQSAKRALKAVVGTSVSMMKRCLHLRLKWSHVNSDYLLALIIVTKKP